MRTRNHTRPSRIILLAVAAALAAPALGATPTITNTRTGQTYASLQAAMWGSVSGDTIELGAGTLNETGMEFNNHPVTIVGQGPDQTFIDANGVPEPFFRLGGGSWLTMEGLTIQNNPGPDLGEYGGGVIEVDNSGVSLTMRNVHVVNNYFDGNDLIRSSAGSSFHFEDCVFSRNDPGAQTLAIGSNGTLIVIGCVFDREGGHSTIIQAVASSSTCVVTNCTFAGSDAHDYISSFNGGNAIVTNCVFDRDAGDGSTIFAGCVWPGATGSNIDASPVFVDAANGDLRLAAGSPGIDAADFDAYIAAGGNPAYDLAGQDRIANDPATADTGAGAVPFLDCGAFEFQGPTADPTGACCLGGGRCVVATEASCLGALGTYQGDGSDCAGVSCDGCTGDLDGDGDTDVFDFNIFAPDFGCDAN